MRLPFVSRGTFDTMARMIGTQEAHYREQIAFAHIATAEWKTLYEQEREARAKADGRVHTLVMKLANMRRDGFEPKPEPAPAAPLLSDPTDDAINARARGNPALRRHLINERARMRAQDMSVGDIADKLSNWDEGGTDE